MPVRQSVTFEDPVNNTDLSSSPSLSNKRSRRLRRSASVGRARSPPRANRIEQKRFLTELQDQVDGVQARTRTVHKIATDGEDMRELRRRDETVMRAPVFNPRLSRAYDKYSAIASSTDSLADKYPSSRTLPQRSRSRSRSAFPSTFEFVGGRPSSDALPENTAAAADVVEAGNSVPAIVDAGNVGSVDLGIEATLADAEAALDEKLSRPRCAQVAGGGEMSQDASWEDCPPPLTLIMNNTNDSEAFYQLVEVRPRVIKHKLKVRPQVEGYEVSVGGGYTAPCQPGPLQADLYDAYRSEILHGRRSRAQFLDDYAIDCGFVAQRHQTPLPVGGSYVAPRASVGPSVTTRVTRAATTTQYAGGDDVLIPAPRRHALGDATINVSKKTVRTASPPPALLSTSTPTAPVLAPIKPKGFGRIHKTEKSSFSNQVDLIGKRADKYSAGSKASLYNVSLADGLEFIRSMLTGGSGFTLADAVQAAKSADIDPYGRKALFNSTMGDGWVGPTENWREKVRKWEQNELSQLEEEQNKRRIAAFHEWEERMGEAEVMESGRAERIKELQKEWAEAELKFREEAMDAERARQARLNEKSVKIEEIDVGEEAKRIKEQKEAERKAAMAKAEADRVAKEQRAAEEEKQKKEAERKKKEEEERKKIEEREAALKREAEERKRIDEEEARKKREEQERIEREKREEEERIKREEEERLRKEREEAERIKREEEERIRKEEEERLRLEEEERKREEEETAKKFGLSGFGGFGADPFAAEEEEEADTADDSQNAGEEQPSRKSSVVSQPADDEGVELIADDEDPQHDYSFASHQDTIVEEEEPTETEDVDTTDKEEDSHHQSYAQDDDGGSLTALSGSIGDGHDDDSSWQETEVSSSTKMGTEVNKDGTVTEEEEVETIPSTGYSVTGGEMPSIEVSGEEDEDQPSSSYTKTTSSWGGEEEEESEDGTRTKKTTTTTTTTTEETSSSRTLKQKASIDTHDHEIIIYNKDGIEITRVTHGDVIVGFDKVDEVVMVKNGLLTVSHESGECLVKIVDGEVNVFEFDGEVIVRSLVDVAHKYLVPKKTERKLSIHDIAAAADDE